MARVKVINRNLNEDLINGAFTNTASKTIFSLGDFAVESNFTGRRTRDYSETLSSFAKEVTLETLNITAEESKNVFDFTTNVKLNFDRSDIRQYVKFGSTAELFRVTIEQIITNYPASLFMSAQANVGGNSTALDYVYDSFTDSAQFRIPSSIIANPYSLIFDRGNTAVPDGNELKNLNLSFQNYLVWRSDVPDNNSYDVIGFTGDSNNKLWIDVIVRGNPFPEVTGTSVAIDFHLKPNILEFNKFVSNLNQLEEYFVSNRLEDQTAFRFDLKRVTLLETGSLQYTDTEILWSTTDGYNPNISGALYDTFTRIVLNIGREYDSIKTDLIARFLTPASLKVYDTTDDGKMTKLLRLYGREFDELRTFIDAIATINKTTYDKNKNIPDVLVKNFARTLGWDVFDLVTEQDITQSFFSTEVETREDNLLPAEIDIELWRRIIINTAYYWKSKGTRHAIKSIFQLIGIPEPFINITEYIYTVEGKINPDDVELSLEDIPSASFPFDSEGYPIAPVETDDFYFQISGNTDNGQEYINLYRDLGFNVNRRVDNKKSWSYSGFTERVHYSTPNYFQEDSRLLINTKEVDVTLDIARGIEYDVYCYNREVDDPITSTGVTRPYIYINVDLDVNDPTTFQLPEIPLSGSAIQMNYNGITLTPPTGATGGTDYDYTYSITPSGASVTINPATAVSATTGQDVVTVTYLYDRLGGTGYTQVQYLVQAPTVQAAGTILQLPEEPKGDVQLTVNGISMSKGTSLVTGDFIIDPNDRTRLIVQNTDLQIYLLSNPVIRTWYIKDGMNPSNAEKRSEVHRVDSLNSNKIFFNAGINKYVYVLDFAAFDIDAVKLTHNGITLQNGTDFTLNPANKRQLYLPPSINIGSVIGAYYIIDDGTFVPPLLPPDPTFPDLQDISFLEYLELITRRLINVTRRKTITDNVSGYYPVVQNLYDEYLRRSFLDDSDPLKSNGYTFGNLYPFINQYNAFFNRFINQLLPATIIIGKGGILIRNTAFTRQKFRYPRGVNFDTSLQWYGNDGSEFVKIISEQAFAWTDDFICSDPLDGTARRYNLSGFTKTQSGVTTITSGSVFSVTDAFSGVRDDGTNDPFNYAAISTPVLATLPEAQYEQRVSDFFVFVGVQDATTRASLLSQARFTDEGNCGVTTTTTTTSTTTSTTAAPTTTTTTTAAPFPPVQEAYLHLANGLARSIDGGVTWAEDNDNYGGLKTNAYTYALTALDNQRFAVASGSDGVIYTTNGGTTWAISNQPWAGTPNIRGMSGYQGNTRIFAWDSTGNNNLDGVYTSTDGGATFSATASLGSIAQGLQNVNAMDSINDRVIVGINEGSGSVSIAASTNGGASWSEITPAITGSFTHNSIQLVDNNTIYVANSSTVQRSDNFGSSWTPLTNPINGRSIDFITPDVGILVGFASVNIQYAITTDGGSTWSTGNITNPTVAWTRGVRIASPTEFWIVIQPTPGGATPYDVYYTNNGGASFTVQSFTSVSLLNKIRLLF